LAQIGPGALALIVGASGVGKDALIAGVRENLSRDPRFAFPERVITRPSNNAEPHASLSEADFRKAALDGCFALTWEAHGLHYGIPASIDDMIRRRQTVITNGSRTIVPLARRRYARVCVILIECPADIRAARLALRGREAVGSIETRLAREVAAFDPTDADVRIDNSGALALGTRALIEALEALADTT
jgi:phosphonate metabolism protein PhnN/1,5-bisphosphokinase (PRPP-forming)